MSVTLTAVSLKSKRTPVNWDHPCQYSINEILENLDQYDFIVCFRKILLGKDRALNQQISSMFASGNSYGSIY